MIRRGSALVAKLRFRNFSSDGFLCFGSSHLRLGVALSTLAGARVEKFVEIEGFQDMSRLGSLPLLLVLLALDAVSVLAHVLLPFWWTDPLPDTVVSFGHVY